MLQLRLKEPNMFKLTKLIAMYNVKAKITRQQITLEGEISEELLSKIISNYDLELAKNYICEDEENLLSYNKKDNKKTSPIPVTTQNYNIIFQEPKRGEVYFCDFGTPYGTEIGYERPAIVIQNDVLGNIYSNSVIVLPCTSKVDYNGKGVFQFEYSDKNVLKRGPGLQKDKKATVEISSIRQIDKTRIRRYLCTMSNEFMEDLAKYIREILDVEQTSVTNSDILTNKKVEEILV